jgi:predicted DNA-binding transcriptional regulator AlpA
VALPCDSGSAMQRNIGSPLQLQRRFVSEVELEQVTGISRRTWQKHRLLNRGPRYYRIHGSIRYELEEVLTWIRTLAVPRRLSKTDPGGAVP